jgi:hypothetical protein
MAAYGHLGLGTEDRLLEFQSYVFPQIGAALGTATAPAPTLPENVGESEEISENVAEILDRRWVEAGAGAAPTPVHPGVAKAVIEGAFLAVAENRVSFGRLFELLLSVRIIGIAVRMELQRKLTVGALDFLFAGSALDPKHLVVVAFNVAGQNGLDILSIISFGNLGQRFEFRATFTIAGRSMRCLNL